MEHERLRAVWRSMLHRCYAPTDSSYARYGGRGITVCQAWQESYEAFEQWALSHGYREGLSIDRIENDGNYSPENCRWVTRTVQGRNRGNNRVLEHGGRRMPCTAWCEERGMDRRTLHSRLRRGWSVAQALDTPVDRSKRRRRNAQM